MGSLHERNRSLWVATTQETDYPPLSGDVSVDVAVISAGITGLSTALLLKRAGVRVAVIEAGRVASGVTGYTTAKVTSLHGLVYDHLMKAMGEERARIYADANQTAIEQVASFVREYEIDCDFRRAAAYTYTEDATRIADIQAEVVAGQRLALLASFTETTELPYPVQGAVRFENQAMFHPRKYCLALAELIPGDGSFVFEMTRATKVEEGSPCEVATRHGSIQAQHVVLATQIPFMDRGGFFAKTSPSRSYALGVSVDGPTPEGMYLSADSPTRSIRPQPVGDQMMLIIGGEGHKVGQEEDTRRRYAALEGWSRERFPVRSIEYRWSAQDYMPVDDVPYIGRLTPASERVYAATGFKKWGMTTGTFAAMIIWDAIMGRENAWSSLFHATRVDLTHSAKQFVTENANVAKRFFGDRLGIPKVSHLTELAPGEGKVVEADGEKLAAYRDEAGILHSVSPICGHMGCVVSWNSAERTWDCPCHGSRYDNDGRAIQGPTVKDLEPKSLPGTWCLDPGDRSPASCRSIAGSDPTHAPEWSRISGRPVRGMAGAGEEEHAAALARFGVLRPHLEEGVPLTRAAQEAGVPLRTAQRWLGRYRKDGLAGLLCSPRGDRGRTHGLPMELESLIGVQPR